MLCVHRMFSTVSASFFVSIVSGNDESLSKYADREMLEETSPAKQVYKSYFKMKIWKLSSFSFKIKQFFTKLDIKLTRTIEIVEWETQIFT